ncbi:MAG: hypothetical protein V5783_01530 [Pontiella sp.]
MKEILVIVVILLGLFLVPRLLRRRSPDPSAPRQSSNKKPICSGLIRLALFGSVLWMALAFALLNPLSGSWTLFIGWGILPVVLCWGIRWVVLGFK